MRPERAHRTVRHDRGGLPFRRVALVANTGWNIVRFRTDLIRTLCERGCQVSAVASFSAEQQEKLHRLGVNPVTIELDAAGHDPIRDLVYLGRLTRALRTIQPDLVHLYTTKPVIYGALAARIVGAPGIVASFVGVGILRAEHKVWLKPILRQLIRQALPERSITVFQNPHDLASFVAEGLTKRSRATCIAGSGVDTAILTPDLETPARRRTRFVMASRMLWSKGVADFVAAARLVKQQHPSASFVLFGGAREDYGSKNPDFIERAWLEQLNRNDLVEWRGWTEPAEVEAAMRTAAAVVLPSYYGEGVPRSLIEAASAGAPIITTDMPGCRDTVLDGQSGFLCPPRSPTSLAQAMSTLLADPERIVAMGRRGRQHAIETFDQRIVMEQILATYQRAMEAASRSGHTRLRPHRARSS